MPVIGGPVLTKFPQDKKITKLAFRARFFFAEKVAIESAAETNAALRVMLKDQEAAKFIDLARKDLKEGILALVQLGLLTADRADTIMNAPIKDIEKYAENE